MLDHTAVYMEIQSMTCHCFLIFYLLSCCQEDAGLLLFKSKKAIIVPVIDSPPL